MSEFDYDMFVIGAGSGGVRAARMAAGFGARIGIAEDRYMGGTCVNVGCVPKKLFVYAAHFAEDFHDAAGFGWQLSAAAFDWQTLLQNKNTEIKRLNDIYRNLLADSGATLYEERARIVDAHTVAVGDKQLTAERILVATGGWPSVPDIPGKQHITTSNEAFYLDELPKQAIIVGGGYIAVEFAGIFNGLGVETTLVYRGELFLRGFDDEIRTFLKQEMQKKGIHLLFNKNITRIDEQQGQLQATFTDASTQHSDLFLYATGRHPNTANLGLENTDVALNDKGAIIVNDDYQTTTPSIYALGDVTDRINLTPVATAEGTVLAHHLFKPQSKKVDYRDIASCVFSQPNIGTVGLTEAEAREKYDDISLFRSSFRHLKHSLSGNEERTLMKIIVDTASDRVVGVHMVGADAGEIIQGMAIAIKAGATKAVFDATIGIHPTAAEEFVTMREPG